VAVQAGEISAQKAAVVANQMRNQIMEMQRLRDFDLGRSLARVRKAQGLALERAIGQGDEALRLGRQGLPWNP
jgi:hypothetical protein